jgi:hypothetical protein
LIEEGERENHFEDAKFEERQREILEGKQI